VAFLARAEDKAPMRILVDLGICGLCGYLAIKALLQGHVGFYRIGLALFPRNDGRPPARGVYTRDKDPGSYWLVVISSAAGALAMGLVVIRDL